MRGTINKLKMVAGIALASLLFMPAFAVANDIIDTKADALFVPQGFDDNDQVQVVLDGWLTSSCEQLVKPDVEIDRNNALINITPRIELADGICMPVLRRYTQVVDLGVLPLGDYEVATNQGALSRVMPVAEASSAGPDENMYAKVTEAFIDYAPDAPAEMEGHWSVVVSGKFTNSCQRWKEIKVIDSGNVFEVLPIIEEVGEVCAPVMESFHARAFLPDLVAEGRYLLHVRSAGGKALNNVFSVNVPR